MRDAFGHCASLYAFEAFRVAEIVTPDRLALRPHRHSAAQICFVSHGSYSERWPGGDERMKAGDLFFRPAECVHEN